MSHENPTSAACPCGGNAPYEACCGPLHDGARAAEDPVELLRSRYAAFVKQKVDYVLETTDPEQRARVDREETERWAREAEWLGLEVREARGGGEGEDEAWIDFCARYRQEDVTIDHVERAHFVRRDGRWWFDPLRSGPPPLERARPVGRNDPCPCGSGRKFKKCCGAGR